MNNTATELTEYYLRNYLKELFRAEEVEVVSIVKFPRGISRETWFIECNCTGMHRAWMRGKSQDFRSRTPWRRRNASQKLILRRDLPALSVVPTSLRFEYEIYRCLQGSRVPVAPVLVFEDDPAKLPDERPFYIRQQIAGSWDVPHYLDAAPQFDELRIEAAKEHIRKLALIHTCDWQALGFGNIMQAPERPEDCAHAAIERNWASLAKYQFEPLPIMTEAREWLHDHAPVATRISLLKGTNGRGEEVFRDGVIVAMSDWEQASLGDPASDFARTQDFFTEIVRDGQVLWGLKEALAYYRDLTGMDLPLTSIEYYRVLNCFENLVALHHAAAPLADGSDRLARLAWLSTEVMHYANQMLLGATSNRKESADRVFSTQAAAVTH
ncbi:hypothetical protein FQZ97_527790 [compost metagenome]